MRCLGIDYGTKRIGLAHGDEVGVATPLPALLETDSAVRWLKLGELIKCAGLPIWCWVILTHGRLGGLVGSEGSGCIRRTRLKEQFGLPVHLVDETLTSYAAEATIAKKSRRDVRDSGLIDSRAACLILQDFLDQKIPHYSSGSE